MCGRFPQSKSLDRYLKRLGLTERHKVLAELRPTWNLAPTRPAWVIRRVEDQIEPAALTWGFKDGSAAPGLAPINARVETAATKFLFRDAWRKRRCLVPADGWYEWRLDHGRKQPYFFHRMDDDPVFFAGLWAGDTFCLLTTAADGELTKIHDSRPIALPTDDSRRWIEDVPPSIEQVVASVMPAGEIGFYPVGVQVSNPRNDGPSLIVEARATPPPIELDLFQNST
jgi:putative SOS response-associated peptidase YedK